MTVLAQDTFIRANQSGWGTASDGNTWTQLRGTQTLSIASNEGVLTYPGNQTTGIMALSSGTQAAVEGLVRFSVSTLTDLAGIALRVQDANNFYSCVVGNTSQTITFRKDVASTFSTVGTAVAFTYTTGTFYWMRFRVSGSDLYAKAWADGSSEPDWMMIASDASISTAGRYGLLGTPTATGNTTQYDHFTATDAPSSLIPRGSAVAATTLTAAGKLFNTTGGTSGSTSTKVGSGSGTNYKQIFAKGTSTGQGNGVTSIPAPTDSNFNGWMWDVTTLEGQLLQAGLLTPTVHLLASTGTTVTPTVEWYKRSSGGAYTQLATVTGSSIALTTSSQALTFTAPSMSDTAFATGDKLVMWLWVNQTAGGGTNSTISVVEATSASSAGVASEAQTVTPGYIPIVTTTYSFTDLLIASTNFLGSGTGQATESLSASEALLAAIGYSGTESLSASDSQVSGGAYIPLDAIVGTTSPLEWDVYLPADDALAASDSSTMTQVPVGGGVTTTTYNFTDVLTATDSLLATDVDIPLDALSASDSTLVADSSLFTESNVASDGLSGGETGTFTDSLSTSDSLLESGMNVSLDANTASDALLKVDGYLPLDALSVTDNLLGIAPYLPMDGLTGATTPLEWDIYLPTDDGLSASDSSSMTQGPPGGGPANNTYNFTDALVASDALLAALVDVPVDGLSVADALVCSEIAGLIDALSASDMGGLARSFVDALSISDALVQSDVYLPADVQSVLESVLARDSTLWVDALSVSDTFTALIVSSQPLQYINVTWVTRDMAATWVTRDGKATWVTRDDKASWSTRDEQASWKTRDDLATWKTRR